MAKKETKEPTSKSLFGESIAKENSNEDKMKSNAPSLFDYMNMMFQNPKEFSKLRSYEKEKNFFMMQRFFSIKHPIQAGMLNNLRINSGEAVQYWCDSLSKIYNRTPQWIWNALKEVKKKKEIEKKKLDVKESTISYYCMKNACSRRDVDDAFNIYGNKFVEELKILEKSIS